MTATTPTYASESGVQTRKAYQFLNLRVQLLGRGITAEIQTLYVNGKRLKAKAKTLPEFLNYLGAQGFCAVTSTIETEGVYTYFYTMQREVITSQQPDGDIFAELNNAKEGATFGESMLNLFEGGLDRLA